LSLDRILVSHHPELGRNVDSLKRYLVTSAGLSKIRKRVE
jgi:Icc-related predicted phosphoesterase